MYKSILGQNIRFYRKLCGLTQAELAKRLFVSPQNLSKWERGTTNPDIWNLYRLSEIFGISCDKLLGKDIKPSERKIMLAADGGSTKTELLLFSDNGDIIRRTILAATNPNACGIEKACSVLKCGIDGMLASGVEISAMFFGIAGCGDATNRKAIISFLRRNYPGIDIDVNSDLYNVIHTQMPSETYASVICGTGSIVGVKTPDGIERIGGFGYLFDNSFSGYQLGRDAIHAAFREENGIGVHTLLTSLVEQKLGGRAIDMINRIYSSEKDFIASFASTVFQALDSGDDEALRIFSNSVTELSHLINHAVKKFNCQNTVVLSGGLTNRSDLLIPALKELCPGLEFTVTSLPQIYGAAMYCCEKFADKSNEFASNLRTNYELLIN